LVVGRDFFHAGLGFGGDHYRDQKGGIMENAPVYQILDTATTVSWSAKTSHRFYDRETRLKLGITDGQLRFSVGLENVRDIIVELSTALE
jgi:O-acetylhomoserine/O-acetylserine sulfhydrylase-like pyridoxal-dependent enzyme